MNDNDVAVSIICNTYNHEKYIRQALEGFVNQKFKLKFEVLIHDDASTDNTKKIIEEFSMMYPNIIKPFFQIENQYSKNSNVISNIQMKRAKGKYIAMCEGDDYWIDPYKIQKQYDAMESNLNIDLCAHSVKLEKEGKNIATLIASKKNRILTIEEMIINGGGYVGTCSLFYRRNLDINIPEFRNRYRYDYSLQLLGALKGGVLFLKDVMGVYRVATENSWTTRIYYNNKKRMNHNKQMIDMLDLFNLFTNKKYNIYIDYMIKTYIFDSAIQCKKKVLSSAVSLFSLKYCKVYFCYGLKKTIIKIVKIILLCVTALIYKHD